MSAACLRLLFCFIACVFLFQGTAGAGELSYVCVKTVSESYPASLDNGVETRLSSAEEKKKTKARLHRAAAKLKALKTAKKRSTHKKSKRLAKKIFKTKSALLGFKKLLKLFSQCKGGSVSSLFPQIIRVDEYILAAGSVVEPGSDLTIETQENITINGKITAAAGSGASITLHSVGGNIVIGSSGAVSAGDGENGKDLTQKTLMRAAAGLLPVNDKVNGGDVILKAAGAITVKNGGAIHIGNGSDGGTATIKNLDKLAGEKGVVLPNYGGDSGAFGIEAKSISGLDAENVVINGVVGWRITGLRALSGGRAGNAGAVIFPAAAESNRFPALPHKGGVFTVVKVTGAKGGDGFIHPGNGQSVIVKGRDAKKPGTDGQSVEAVGGAGGHCRTASEVVNYVATVCTAGRGGSARATAGRGADAKKPGQKGGEGGDATAIAGPSGDSSDDDILCATAHATGGSGGLGGGKCSGRIGKKGGGGGAGGLAIAQSSPLGCAGGGVATARGGDGGDGGDARVSGQEGPGGVGGGASSTGGVGSKSFKGSDGSDGFVCEAETPSPSPTPPDSGGVSSKSGTFTYDLPCPTAGTVTYQFIVYLPQDAVNMSHQILDASTGKATARPICPGADESDSVAIDPSGVPSHPGKKAYVVTIVTSNASAAVTPVIKIKVTYSH